MRRTTKAIVATTLAAGTISLGIGACIDDTPTGNRVQPPTAGQPLVVRSAYARGTRGMNVGGEHNRAMLFARDRLLRLQSDPRRRNRWHMCKDVLGVAQAYLAASSYANDPNAAIGLRAGLEEGACRGAIEYEVLDAIAPRSTTMGTPALSSFTSVQGSQPSLSPYAQALVDSMKQAPVETFARFHSRTTQLASRAAGLPEVEREYVGSMAVVADSSYRYWVDDWSRWFPGDRPPCTPSPTRSCQGLAAFLLQVGPGMTPQQKENVRTVLKGDVMGAAAGFLRMIPGLAAPGVGWAAVGTSMLWSAIAGSATAAVGIATFGGGGGGGSGRPMPTCPADKVIDVNTGGCRTMAFVK